jgi:hypothetical protein
MPPSYTVFSPEGDHVTGQNMLRCVPLLCLTDIFDVMLWWLFCIIYWKSLNSVYFIQNFVFSTCSFLYFIHHLVLNTCSLSCICFMCFDSLVSFVHTYTHTHTHTHIHISWIRHLFNDGLNIKLVINNIGLWYTVLS